MTSPVDLASDLVADIRANAETAEADRRVPDHIIRAMAERGLFRLCVPSAYGGSEVDPLTLVRVLETIAIGDGSTGWVAMIGATTGALGFYLPEEGAAEVYSSDPEVLTGGVFAPRGVAHPDEGGFRVTGRWGFASGCEHATWLIGGSLVDGLPPPRQMVFRASEVRVLDTWRVSGLRGTGSHDMAVEDVFVPESRQASIVSEPPRLRTPLSAFPVFGLLAVGIAAVCLGIARAAVDELIGLASVKKPEGSGRLLYERPGTQAAVGAAEGELRAARAFLEEALSEVWEAATQAGEISVRDRALVRLAATHATHSAASTVDLMYSAGGGTSIYETSPLQRHFRDIHTATQHMMVAPPTLELTGRVLLGLDTDTSQL